MPKAAAGNNNCLHFFKMKSLKLMERILHPKKPEIIMNRGM